jgi:hypothetical protein
MGLPSPIKSRLRNRFLVDYAKLLRDDLDEFVDGSGTVHRASVLAGRTSQVIIEVFNADSHHYKPEIVPTNQPPEWLPNANAIISFEAPNRVIVTRPSEYFEQMLHWSNVQAWEDAGFIISHILTTQR